MKFIYDPHTHTNYSHGDNTVEEMVESAVQKGMTEIHITEHGNMHWYARKLKKDDFLRMKDTIFSLREKYPQIKIVFGIEANIVSTDGDLDFSPEDMEMFDVVNMGFHSLCRMKNLRSYINIHLWAILAYKLKIKAFEKRSVKYCTKAMLNALEKYEVNMITHPQSNYKTDLISVAKMCEKTGTIFEINNSRSKLSTKELMSVKDMNIRVACGSDAHKAEDVAKCNNSLKIIEESGISLDKVINVE
ncbi:MAG: PHP domain-containing protein [Anaerofustis stercorihominis]|nr:PHP domain-containing protein [Anaerofustis stercorihominis]